MIKQVFIFVAFLFVNTGVFAQKDQYDQHKTQYDSLRKAENYESALLVAKQMNTWSLKNETDTSLRYAVSLQFIGRSFYNLQNFDSSKYYFEKTLRFLEKQNRSTAVEYTETLNSLGIIQRNLGEFMNAEKNFLKAISIRDSLPTKQGHKPKYQNRP